MNEKQKELLEKLNALFDKCEKKLFDLPNLRKIFSEDEAVKFYEGYTAAIKAFTAEQNRIQKNFFKKNPLIKNPIILDLLIKEIGFLDLYLDNLSKEGSPKTQAIFRGHGKGFIKPSPFEESSFEFFLFADDIKFSKASEMSYWDIFKSDIQKIARAAKFKSILLGSLEGVCSGSPLSAIFHIIKEFMDILAEAG